MAKQRQQFSKRQDQRSSSALIVIQDLQLLDSTQEESSSEVLQRSGLFCIKRIADSPREFTKKKQNKTPKNSKLKTQDDPIRARKDKTTSEGRRAVGVARMLMMEAIASGLEEAVSENTSN